MPPKRVILRLRDNDFPDFIYSDIIDCVNLYLALDGRPEEPVEELVHKHHWHYQPANPDYPNQRFHVIIDVDKEEHTGPVRGEFSHELYRVANIKGAKRIVLLKNKLELENFLRKMRQYTDTTYPWGEDISRTGRSE
ncbi:hypothetical protein N7539_007151 [Penicillium diatomitis]|uniref:Uncharacterized protein n=1 Tax=Penicillium diatomitis TaxID=2819901 RepID=A0A9X0BNV9_9EURO|nr:uncharacterized protein N7539_007151 [Penicillium diatomitis]KAJ5477007.1 hypothetical protein N7539_007151 [Penicillium diatomitis]